MESNKIDVTKKIRNRLNIGYIQCFYFISTIEKERKELWLHIEISVI